MNVTLLHLLNMENIQKIPPFHKRRSSTFQSRSIAFEQDKGNWVTSSNQYQDFNLEEYMNYLKEERRKWQYTYKERKKQRRHLLKKKKNMEVYGQDFNANILSDSEKCFFSVAPDYNQIHTNFTNLVNMTLKIAVLSQLRHKLSNTFVLKMEEKINNIIRTIIETTKAHN